MAVLNDFVLFLKQESGSRAQGSKAQGSKARGMKKAFSEVLQAKSKIKNILNSIYTTLQAEALIFIFLYLPSVFSCQSCCPRRSPLKADPHEVSTCGHLPIRIRHLINGLKLRLHDAIYRLRFYSNLLIHVLLLSNSHNNVASLQKNRNDKSHRVIVALFS